MLTEKDAIEQRDRVNKLHKTTEAMLKKFSNAPSEFFDTPEGRRLVAKCLRHLRNNVDKDNAKYLLDGITLTRALPL